LRPHQLIVDYFIDLSRLVSTNKLVENGFHVIRPHGLYVDYAVRSRDVVFWAYDYLDYLPRLVSTRKLVEDGSRDINN
jgi:hypothetical protein